MGFCETGVYTAFAIMSESCAQAFEGAGILKNPGSPASARTSTMAFQQVFMSKGITTDHVARFILDASIGFNLKTYSTKCL